MNDSKKTPTEREKEYAKRVITRLLIMCIILTAFCSALVFMGFTYLVVLVVISLLPSGVAMIVDRRPRKFASKTVTCFNFAGLLPAMFDTFMASDPDVAAQQQLADPYIWLMIYGFAGFGWLVVYTLRKHHRKARKTPQRVGRRVGRQSKRRKTMIIDGKAVAEGLCAKIAAEITNLKIKPGLAVVLVGEDPASQVYVKNKAKMTEEVGMQSFEHKLPAETSERALIRIVEQLNNNPAVHGILVQLPLPKHISENAVIEAIAPEKDVDGFHVVNSGKLATGQDGLVPCTPLGSMILIKQALGNDLAGKHAVVIGRSNIVGKPMASLLLQESCTVTIIHSKTINPQSIAAQADILVAAIGKPKFITKDWVKAGACVIDVGINRDANNKLCGDVDFENVKEIAGSITPVPGGVGPMTIACLLKNTLTAYTQQMSK